MQGVSEVARAGIEPRDTTIFSRGRPLDDPLDLLLRRVPAAGERETCDADRGTSTASDVGAAPCRLRPDIKIRLDQRRLCDRR